MNRVFLFALLLIAAAVLSGCSSSEHSLQPRGDFVRVVSTSQGEFTGELLAIQGGTVIILRNDENGAERTGTNNHIVRVDTSDLRRIEVQGYSERGWLTYVIIFEAVPALVFAVEAGAYDSRNFLPALTAGALLTGLNLVLFETSTPSPPSAQQPLIGEKLYGLAKYARFPQSLPAPQLDSLLNIYKDHLPATSKGAAR